MDKTEAMAQMESRQLDEGPRKRHGPTKLLDDADLNIGNAQTVTAGTTNITKPITNPSRILNLNAEARHGSMVTVGITAAVQTDGTVINTIIGPVTAVLEFGNGGVFTQIEIDVPVGKIDDLTIASSATDGVLFASLPAGTLRVYGRNDANLITPSIGNTFGSPTAAAGQSNTSNAAAAGSTLPILMKAFAVYEDHALSLKRCTKTVCVYTNSGVAAAVPAGTIYWVPAFARSVQVYRNTAANATAPTALTVRLQSSPFVLEQYSFAAGVNCPIIPISGNILFIGVSTDAPINFLSLVFEIGV